MKYAVILLLLFFAMSCIEYRHAYYISPVSGTASFYPVIPLHYDSVRCATYGEINYISGTDDGENANEDGGPPDYLHMFRANIYQSRNWKMLDYYYGGGFTAGKYSVTPIDSGENSPEVNINSINDRAGKKPFGNAQFNAGVNVVDAFRLSKSEWRVLGLHTSLNREFGQYLSFRNALSPDSVTGLVKSNFLGTIGISTEIVGKMEKGQVSVKLQENFLLGKNYRNIFFNQYFDDFERRKRYNFFELTGQITYWKFTGYLEANWGYRMSNVQIGCSYRIGSSR